MLARVGLGRVLTALPPRCHRPNALTTSHLLGHHHPSTSLESLLSTVFTYPASTSSSTRWKSRQSSDPYTRQSKLSGLKSRAAYKLLEIDAKHHLFRRGDTVVDLGFAPGSWSQVAANRTSPGGRVVGIDVIPAQPPRGVNALQGNFLSEEIRAEVGRFVREEGRGRVRDGGVRIEEVGDALDGMGGEVVKEDGLTQKEMDVAAGRVVDVVLSDMSEPWPMVYSKWVRSVSNPYSRMQNTSGMPFRDHAGSMDLCMAALTFSFDTLRTGGNFLCKFFAGAEDHALEMRLKKLFDKVYRIKPDSSRKESKEAYFVALKRKAGVEREDVLGEG
ncbi:uncharacterized protein MYCGRDRAFT_73148 [Zymoseptoria tritici IPO323]|uniref:rRNA methyltransferase 2, mitochondrial n=1 Tax=Zymoseptoria tritici (strain CBS 115943 / IPO323) TaxID=336722 RepID=F9XDE9_ZYMTI|nr:uncharacterized protein MYCGRDRAFT_73148 [Zymoseptoria tritici IPO323]EGP86484.1 hypothetical protein MYCGRDRAFT_73148 [Zymoseptoria tritici IPO323]